MLLTLVALACLIGWRMTSEAPGAKPAATDLPLQIGMTVAPAQESYACTTPEQSGQAIAFQIVGAQDKLRGLLDRGECARVSMQQRFKVLALQEKLAQVTQWPTSSATALWIPARNLTPVAS